jgi:DNA-binding LacI/PurR family transcriptional regulator
MPTLKEVAARAGVSYQTVSKVLNGQLKVASETEQRILAAAQGLGYRPNQLARNMRQQRSRMIGYSWEPGRFNQVNNILDAFLSSMVLEAEAAGYHLLPFPNRDGAAMIDAYRDLMDTGRVDGFVLSSVNYNDPRIQFLSQRDFPFVAFGRSNPELAFPFVDVDGAAGQRAVVEHLLANGHQRIAVIAWPADSRVGSARMAGYEQALHGAQIALRPEWIMRGEGTAEFGREAAARFLNLPARNRPSAIVAFNDTTAIGAMQAARERGLRVGKDLAVVGFDDTPMAQYLDPPLTSVRQPIREAGRACVEMLVGLMEGRPPAQTSVLLPPKLILRASG